MIGPPSPSQIDTFCLLLRLGICPSLSVLHAIRLSKGNPSSMSLLLNHIRASGEQLIISGYLINSYQFQNSEVTNKFWKLQLSIISQLHQVRSLSVIVAIVIHNHDGHCIQMFIRGLKAAHWKVSTREVLFPEIGDSVADS